MISLFFISTLLLSGCQKENVSNLTDTSSSVISPVKLAAVKTTSSLEESGVVSFDANLDQNNDLSAYANKAGNRLTAMVINPDCIAVVNDPAYGAKRKVMRMNVGVQQTAGVTENPRAQVQTPMDYVAGQEVYVGLSVRFTQTFWTYFLTFAEFYGAPYKGTSPFRLAVQADNLVASATNGTNQKNLWQEPLRAGVWYDFVYREVLDADPSQGHVQVWMRKQGESEFQEIVPDTKMATITSANLTGPNYHKLACYYDRTHTYTNAKKVKGVSSLQMYLTNHKVGSTFDMVAPKLIR